VDESRLMYCTYEKVHHIGQVHISVLFYFVHHDRHFSYLCITTPFCSLWGKKPSRNKKIAYSYLYSNPKNLSIFCFSCHSHCSLFIKCPHIHNRFSLLFIFFAFTAKLQDLYRASIFLTYYRSRCDLVTDAHPPFF